MKEKTNVLQYIKEENFVASKKMGQNFLINQNIKQKIVNVANIEPNTLVIEIGPGLGAITEIILKKDCYLLAIELDKRLADFLKQKFASNSKFNLVCNDFLKINLASLIKETFGLKKFAKIIIIANLPYSVSSKIIQSLILSTEIEIDYAIIMVQKEMAERLVARIGTKNYNAFSAWIQNLVEIEKLFDVSKNNFIPAPKVVSSVIKISFLKNKLIDKETILAYKDFFFLCFQNRRKTLVNNLSAHYQTEKIKTFLETKKMLLTTRAEALTTQELIQLFNFLKSKD